MIVKISIIVQLAFQESCEISFYFYVGMLTLKHRQSLGWNIVDLAEFEYCCAVVVSNMFSCFTRLSSFSPSSYLVYLVSIKSMHLLFSKPVLIHS